MAEESTSTAPRAGIPPSPPADEGPTTTPANRSSIVSLLKRDRYGWFLLAAAGLLLLAPRFIVLGDFVLDHVLAGSNEKPDLSNWPYVPVALPVAVTIALLTFFARRETRLVVLVVMILPLGWIYGRINTQSILPLSLFLLATFAIIRLPVRRVVAGTLVSAFATGFLIVLVRWLPGHPVIQVLAMFPVLVPMLWYSVYEHGRRALPFHRFAPYMAGRIFSSPVLTYADLFTPVTGQKLTETRWAGIRAIGVALLASIAREGSEWSAIRFPTTSLTGFPLWIMSYIAYVGHYCSIVVRFNIFIGVMRLFGIPIRDNFRYWLLARTPNEHWQRWNLLAREWVLTFVFYPIMRSQRWLFAAVMAALLISGSLHYVPTVITRGFEGPRALASLLYWGLNGLAIYAVIMIPRRFPGLVGRLRLAESRGWWVVGLLLTSAFYAVLHGIRRASTSWGDMLSYLSRLVGGA